MAYAQLAGNTATTVPSALRALADRAEPRAALPSPSNKNDFNNLKDVAKAIQTYVDFEQPRHIGTDIGVQTDMGCGAAKAYQLRLELPYSVNIYASRVC